MCISIAYFVTLLLPEFHFLHCILITIFWRAHDLFPSCAAFIEISQRRVGAQQLRRGTVCQQRVRVLGVPRRHVLVFARRDVVRGVRLWPDGQRQLGRLRVGVPERAVQ